MVRSIPLGATVTALLVLPVGIYLLSQTALSPVHFPPRGPIAPAPESAPLGPIDAERLRSSLPQTVPAAPSRPDEAVVQPEPQSPAEIPSQPFREQQADAVPPSPPDLPHSAHQQTMPRDGGWTGLPAPASPAIVMAPSAGDRFTAFEEGGTRITAEAPVSTFSVDVDTAAYAYVRRTIEGGALPPPDAVRVEELINYFSYDYPAPASAETPFEPTLVVHPSPWNPESRLLHIGLKGYEPAAAEMPPANLVFLVDTSGSMDQPDRLPLLQRALGMLVDQLGPDDRVSIVTYAGAATVALEPTSGADKARIRSVLDGLSAAGSTAGSDGIQSAYRMAEEAFIEGGTNRVILATDGDFNVGVTEPGALERLIRSRRDAGISLSVLGFGTGNYNDAAMQALAQNGNGNAAYIDSLSEARKALVEEFGGTLMTIASDVKIQLEFNPATVAEYRLVGYETRGLRREDFNNDRVDAGDVGAGHTVTAIYEMTPVGAPGASDPLRYGDEVPPAAAASETEYGYFKLRYKLPGEDESRLYEEPILVGDARESLDALPADIKFATAVAAFGQKLRGSDHLADMDWTEIAALAEEGRGSDPTGRRAEFIRLVELAGALAR